MNDKNRVLLKRILWLLPVLLLVVFIWSNSLKAPNESSSQSGWVLDFFRSVNAFLHINLLPTSEFIIRKAAHFSEYALLGLALVLFVARGFSLRIQTVVNTLFFGFGVAVVDETLQILSQRGSSLTDVWIDTAGLVCGTLAFLLCFCIICAIRGKLKQKGDFNGR